MLRIQLLIPFAQIVSVMAAMRSLRRWRLEPAQRPGSGLGGVVHILLQFVPDLLTALTLVPVLGRMRGYLMLFMPDFSWLARICGSFGLLWSILHARLIVKALK
ncbi:MAG: hypothetical protein PVJ75_17430 [Chloroflexota bacterium]